MKKAMKRTRSVLLCILIAALLMPTLSMLAGASVENTDEGWSVDLPFDTSTFGTDSTIFDSLNAKTGFNHPYLFANAQDFAAMKARYDAGTDETFVAYVDSIIAEADAFIIKQTENNFTEADIESGSYSSETLKPYLPVNFNYEKYPEENGYDFGGRLNVLSNPLNENGTGGYASILEALGFAYQLTGNSFYGEFAYDWTLALCDWDHWGPGHFLNAAEATAPLALSYDWLYGYYVANGKDVDVIRNAIYEKGVAEGYISSNGWFTEYTSSIGAWANKYHNTHNNWNPVCTNGMLIAAFSIMNDFAGDDETTFAISHYATQGGSLITNTYDASDAVAQAKYVVNNNLYYLAVNGLDFFNQDGSYIESSGYWAGSVRSLFSIFALLDSAVGTDFGFMEIPKLLNTAYFGVHIESSDYMSWPYHDDSARQLEHSWYYYIAKATGAYDLAGIRESELANGKRVFMWDVLHYDAIANATEASLPLDFAMNDIDGFVSRSSWTPGALYAGLMGGDNSTFGMHGHIDSGNWIYDNGGLRWFTDLGSDNYTIFEGTGYDGKKVDRWNYYKNGGEGQNNLILVGHDDVLPYGQTKAIVGNLERYADNLGGKGSYAIINNDTTYGSFVTSAKRGMLVTNDRSTVVIQDEVVTSGDAETFWWFAHYDTGRVRYVEISEDGRTAYMTGSNGKKLRVSLISDNTDLKFVIKDTYNDFVLENTVKEGYSVANGGDAEAGRNSYRKLAIKAENVTSLNLAVVIELIGSETDPVGYTSIIPMSEWDDDTVQSGSHLTTPGNGYTVYYKDGSSVTYDNSVITEESIKNVDIVRVVCHGNVVISTDSYNRNESETELQLAPGQELTIDLNGYTLIQSDELQLGLSGSSAGTSLTLVGGTLLPSNTIMARQETSLIMKDMVIIMRSAGCLIRNNRFTNLVFDGCTVEISGYLFASNMVDDGAGKEHNLIIKDTTMTLGTGLMMYGNGGWTNKYSENLNVYLFGDSSFMYGALENIIINGGADATDGTGDPGGERNFYVAVGTKLSSAGLPLPESADGQNYTAYYYSKINVDDDYNVTLGTPLSTQYDFIKSGTTYNGNDIYTVVCTDDTKYEIIFKDYDGTVISREEYGYGDTVILPAAPQRPADNTYTYAFAGWDSEVVDCTGNATYTATYTATFIEYTVIFKNDDGAVLSEKTYHYGDAVTAPEAVRTDKTYTYTFIAWDKDVTSCTGNATYTAIYSREYINYTVVFKDDDGRVLSTDTYHYGDTVAVPEAPTKAANTIYVYTFSGWDKPVVNCAGNVIYVAVYDREPVDFAVDFGGIKPNPVRIDSAIAAQLVSAGYSYLQFTDEAAFNTANAGGYYTLAAGGKSGDISVTGNAYVYLLANTSLTTYNPSAANLKVWLNLGGNKLTWKCSGGGANNHDLAIFDGTVAYNWFTNYGHALYRVSGSGVVNVSLSGVNLTTNHQSARYFSAEATATLNLYIENSTVNATHTKGSKPIVYMGFDDAAVDAPVVNFIIKNSEMISTGLLISVDSVCTANSKASVYIDGNSKLDVAALFSTASFTPTVTIASGARFTEAAYDAITSAPITLVTESGAAFVGNSDTTYTRTLMFVPVDINFTVSDEFRAENGAFVVYASEYDFYADLEGGVIDGLVNGNSVLVDDNNDTFPSSGYVCMLEDYTLQPTATINVADSLMINLGGTTLTELGVGGLSGGNLTVATIAVAAGGKLGIYNGAFYENVNTPNAMNTLAAGATLEIKHAHVSQGYNWENWSSLFYFTSGGYATLRDCTVVQSKKVTVIRAGSGTLTVDLVGINYTDKGGHNVSSANGKYFGFISSNTDGGAIVVNVDKTSVVNSGNLVNRAYETTSVTVNAEVGFTMAKADFVNADALNVVDTLNFYNNGELVTDSARFILQTNGLYTLTKGFTVVFKNEDGTVISTNIYYYGDEVLAPETPTKAADNTYTYTFAGWDSEVVDCTGDATYTATYDSTYIEYTVIFEDEDGTVLSEKTYHYADAVTAPDAPTKAADNTYTYAFAGWDSEVVNCAGDATYTATYTATFIEYTVIFKNDDGTILSEKTYHYGDAVTAPDAPVKAADNTYTYAFAGWGSEVVNCAGDATYTATYTATFIEYTVIFKNDDGTVLSEKTYHYGDAVTAPEAPVKAADNTYTYTFAGWDSEVVNCAGDATYTATYTATFIEYTVIFKNDDGTVLSEKTYHYGDAVTAPEAVRTDKIYNYTFVDWDKDVTDCTGNATYTAIYSTEYINYTVVFKDDDGRVFSTDTYHYGDAVAVPEAPTKAANAIYTYTFAGWDKEVVNCAGNATYTATYDKVAIDPAEAFNGIKPNLVRIDSAIAAQLVEAGFNYLEFADEAAFNTANAGGYDALAAGGKTGEINVTGGTYIYLLANTTLKSYSTTAHNLSTWINLGGNKITWQCNGGTGWSHNLAVFDGDLYHPWFQGTSGHAAYRASGSTSNVSVDKVTFTTNSASGRFFSSEGNATLNLYVNDSTVNAAGKPFVHMGFNATETPTLNLIFKNSEIVSTGTLVNVNNTCTANSKASVYIDGNSKLDAPTLANATNFTPTVTVANGASFTANGRAAVQSAGTLVTESGAEFVYDGTNYILTTVPADTNFTASADFKAANGAFVVYASEFDFYADLEGGVIDGLDASGKSVLVDDNNDTFPSSGYVCMLANYTMQPAAVATPIAATNLKINLGGTTFTQTSPAGLAGGSTGHENISVAANGILGFYNGTLKDGLKANNGTNILAGGVTLELKNITLQATSTWEGDYSATFRANGALNAIVENCTVTQSRTAIILLTSTAAANFDIKGLNHTDTWGHTLVNASTGAVKSNSAFYGFISSIKAATITVNVDGTTVINSGHLVNVRTADANVTVNAELGFTMANDDFMNDYLQVEGFTNFSIVDTLNVLNNGEVIAGDNVSFVQDGNLYVLKALVPVTFYDENGEELFSADLNVGELPAYDYSVGRYVEIDGKIYIVSGGWATEQGGEITEIIAITPDDTSREYYYVTVKTLAAVVVYDADGEIYDSWAEDNLTKAQLGSVPAGGLVQLQMNIEIDRGASIDRLNNYQDGITIDLGGFTMSHSNADGGDKRWVTLTGKTLTIQNGTMVALGADNLFMPAEAGTIVLKNVNLVGGTSKSYPVFDYRGGSLEMYGGSITATVCGAITLTQYKSTDVNIKLMGVDVNVGSNTFISTKLLADRANSITIGAHEGKPTTIVAAAIISVADGTALTAGSKLTVSISDTYAEINNSSYNPIIYGTNTWAEGDSAAIERANVKISVNNFYSNYGLGSAYGNSTYAKGVEVALTDAGVYRVAYVSAPSVDNINANLTLYSDFNLNFYIPTGSNVGKLILGETVLFDVNDSSTYELGDGFYKVSIPAIAPNRAAQRIAITIVYAVDNERLGSDATGTVTAKYSIVRYISDVIAHEDSTVVSEAAKNNAKALAAYIKASYSCFTSDALYDETIKAQLDALVTEEVLAYVNSFVPVGDDDDFTTASVSAQFTSSSVTKLSVSFADGVSWTLNNGTYSASGVGGKCEINLLAYTLCDPIIITAGEDEATFSLGEYVADCMEHFGDHTAYTEVIAALRALYAYGMTARELANE